MSGVETDQNVEFSDTSWCRKNLVLFIASNLNYRHSFGNGERFASTSDIYLSKMS